jgi:hypothetical protein
VPVEGNGGGLGNELSGKAKPECPSCGTDSGWVKPEEVSNVFLPVTDAEGKPVVGGGIPSLVLICERCGFIRLHSVGKLRGDF